MKRARWLVLAAFSVAMMIPAASTIAASQSDGTGGPDEATPDASRCDRPLLDQSAIAGIAEGTPGMLSGSLEAINSAKLSAYPPAGAEIDMAIQALLASYNGCVATYGAAGAYAFLAPGISPIELIYLGVFNPQQEMETPEAAGTPVGMAPVQRIPVLTATSVLLLADGQIGAIVAAPQQGADTALITFHQVDDAWMIARIAPIASAGSTPQSGGGSAGP